MSRSPSDLARVSRDDGYGRSSRFYTTPEGLVLPSVTTILSAVGKPALVNWSAKVEREAVRQAAANLWMDCGAMKMTREAYLASLDERIGKQKAHQKELAKAGEIGTQAHALIEWSIRRSLGQKQGPQPVIGPEAGLAYAAYERWREGAAPAWLLMENTVYSTRQGYAGTMDWYGEMTHDGARVTVVGDWKTGKAIYPEALLQIAAYVHALVEMGHAPAGTGGCVVRLPKIGTDPGFEVRYVTPEECEAHLRVFLHVLELWKWLEAAGAH